MKRAFLLLATIAIIAMTTVFPAVAAAGSGGAALAQESRPQFSLAPAAGVYGQASPDDPVISGTATDESGGAVSGVVVTATDKVTLAVAATDTTDAAGSYSLQVPAGTYDIEAVPPAASGLESGAYTDMAVAGDATLDIVFVPADIVTFSGRLLGRDGTPIPNQTVYLKRTPFGKTATTDEQGNFLIKVPPGDYTLEVISGLFVVPPNTPSSYQVTRSGAISLTGNTTMDITLSEVYLTGRVTDPTGLIPVAAAIVHVSGDTSFGAFSGRFDCYATTDALGNYSAVVYPSSSVTIEATPPDLSLYAYAKETGVSVLSDTTKNIHAPLAVKFSGNVRDRDGDPIAGQNVTIKNSVLTKGGTSDEEGDFSIDAPTGTYTVELSNGFLTENTNAPDTYLLTRDSTVTLLPLIGATANLTVNEAYLTGTVVSSMGTPVPDVQLQFSATGTWGSFSGKFDSYATSDSAGNYSAVVLPSSALSVKATPLDTTPYAYTETTLSVTGDGTRNITLADAVTLSGTLRDRDGDPVPGQIVTLEKPGYSKFGGTDTAGYFSISVPTGTYSLKVASGFFGAPTNVPSSYQVDCGTVSLTSFTTRDITLSEVYVNGKVVGPGDAAVAGVDLALSGSGTWGSLSGTFDCRRTSDGAGNFSAVAFSSASAALQTTPPDATWYGPGLATGLDASQDRSLLVILCEGNDTTPPRAVDNLAVSAAYDISVALSWTSPGDNAAYGTAAAYDIRYSTSPITEANWGEATQCAGEPAPKPAGQAESFLAMGLSPTTTYYFALKTADEAPNLSGLSNVAQATTTQLVNLTVTSVTPDNVPQFSWFVDLQITGTGFQPGAKVELMMGETVIDTSNVVVVSDTSITCSVFILAQTPGGYDVVVTNPSGKEARLYFAFWIGASCGTGSGSAVLMLGLTMGLLSLAGSTTWRRRRRK